MKALLVIDIQERFIKGSKAYQEERFITTVNLAIEEFFKNGDLVVYIHHIKKDIAPETPGWEFDTRVHMDVTAPKVWKTKGNAFDGTDLRKILDKHNIDELTLCGLVTQNCIRSTGLGCLKEGYKTKLIKHGTTNWTENPQKTINEVEAELTDLGITLIQL